MTHTRAIATSTLWQLLSQGVMAILSIITVKFVAVGLSQELAGNYNSAYGFLQLFGILADFGLYAVAIRELSQAKNREETLGTLLSLRLIILLLSLGSALLLVWIVPFWRGTPFPISVSIAALVPFFTLLAGILRTIFQVTYTMHFVFIAEVVQRIITAGLIGVIVLHGVRESSDSHVLYLFLGTGGLGAFVLSILSFVYGNTFLRIRPRWSVPLLKQTLVQAAPFGTAYLFLAFATQFDTTLIAFLRPDFELQNAYYGFVLRMTGMTFLIPTFLLNSTLPLVTERQRAGEDTSHLLSRTFFALLLLGSVAFLFSFLWSRPLMQLLTTEKYLSTSLSPGADTALHILALPMFLSNLILFSFYTLLSRHEWKFLVSVLGIGALVSFLCNLILIPRYGFIGAALTSVITHGFLALLLFPRSAFLASVSLSRQEVIQWCTLTAFLTLLLSTLHPFLVREIHTIIAGGIAIIGIGGVLWIMRVWKGVW